MKVTKKTGLALLMAATLFAFSSCATEDSNSTSDSGSTTVTTPTDEDGDSDAGTTTDGTTNSGSTDSGTGTSGSTDGGTTDGETTENEFPDPVLPASVGTNPFKGKTFTDGDEIDDFGFCRDDESSSITYSFSEDTVVYSENAKFYDSGENYSLTATYKYSYDATNKLLYLGLLSFSFESGDKQYSTLKEWHDSKLEGLSDVALQFQQDKNKSEYDYLSRQITKTYMRHGNTYRFEEYFTGSLPVGYLFFRYNNLNTIGVWASYIRIEIDSSRYYLCYPEFIDNAFSGTLYEVSRHGEEYVPVSVVGTLSGTYTSTGPGEPDEDSSQLSIIFTDLPDVVTQVTKDTEYELHYDS